MRVGERAVSNDQARWQSKSEPGEGRWCEACNHQGNHPVPSPAVSRALSAPPCASSTDVCSRTRSHFLARTSSRRGAVTCTMASMWAMAGSCTMQDSPMAFITLRWKRCRSRNSPAAAVSGRAGGRPHSSARRSSVAHARAWVRRGIGFCTITASTSASGACMERRAVIRSSG